MAGNPADVGGTPVNLAILVIKHILVRHCCLQQVTTSIMLHALGFAGRSRSIENEHRVFSVHGLWLTFCIGISDRFVVPDIAALGPVNVFTTTFDDNAGMYIGAFGHRSVCIGL